jgi:hypothetical protein
MLLPRPLRLPSNLNLQVVHWLLSFGDIGEGDKMTSRVKVNMNVCGKHTTIEVSQREDVDFDVKAETDCDNVREFIDMLGTLSLVDLTDKKASKFWECFKNARMSSDCINPAAVMQAAWIEAGLLSKNLALMNKDASIEYLKD